MIFLDALEFILEKCHLGFFMGFFNTLIGASPTNSLGIHPHIHHPHIHRIIVVTQSWFIFTMFFLLNYNGMWRYVPLELTHGIGTATSLYHLNKFPGFFGGYYTWGRTRYWRLGVPILVSVLSLLSYRFLMETAYYKVYRHFGGPKAPFLRKYPPMEEINNILF